MNAAPDAQAGYVRLPISLRWQLILLGIAVVAFIIASNGSLRESLASDRAVIEIEAQQRERLAVLRDVQQSVSDYRFWLIENAAQQKLTDGPERALSRAQLEQSRRDLDKRLTRMAEFAPSAVAQIRESADGLGDIEFRALEAIIEGRSSDARTLLRAAQQRLAVIDTTLDEVFAVERAAADEVAGAAVAATDNAMRRSLWMMLVASALTALMVFLILQSTLPALRNTIDAIDELVRGRFDTTLPPVAPDELGQVALGLRQFRDTARRLEKLATTDPLTELVSRVELHRLIDATLDELRDGRFSAALLFLDLDQFKSVNDALGHSAGDRYLQEVARRLRRALPGAAAISRLSGDEFGVLLRQAGGVEAVRDAAAAAVRAVADAFSHNYILEDQPVAMSASIGITIAQRDGWSADALLARAEAAMYAAKGDGRAQFRFYEPAMTDRVREHLAVGSELRKAILENALTLHYQPIVRARNRQLVSAEALIRWEHPRLGRMLPERFVPIAEETQTIIEMGDWVIHTACEQAARWRSAGLPPCPIAVNIGAGHFADDSLMRTLVEAIADNRLPPDALEVEITESAVIADPQRSAEVMRAIRARGVRLSLDDFGTGYSSLAYLQQFPLDKLKVDQTFVLKMLDDEGSDTIVSATIGLANQLGLTTVGEGVETRAALDRLSAHGCDLIQGYFIGRPMVAEDFGNWLAMQRPVAHNTTH